MPNQPPTPNNDAPKKRDTFHLLKLRAYRRLYPHTIPGMTVKDYVIYAKALLCEKTGTLWHDPIWDSYTDEEILIEHFAHIFLKDSEACAAFERAAGIIDEDMYEWLDRQVAENQVALAELRESQESTVEYKPGI